MRSLASLARPVPRRAGLARPRVAAVIGGAGFIGSHLCEALLAAGRQVVCIDNFERGSVGNLTGFVGQALGTVVSHDATRPIPDELPRFDEIYHLAAPASGGRRERSGQAWKTARMAASVLGRAARDGACVLLASSWEAQPRCGTGTASPGRTEPGGAVEALFTRWAARRGVPLRVARIFETYGPRLHLDGSSVTGSVVIQALRREALSGPGRGEARLICFVDDVVDGCLRLMADGGGRVGPVNIVEPLAVSPDRISEVVRRLTQERHVEAAHHAADAIPPRGDRAPAKSTRPDASRPATLLHDGLSPTIDEIAARLGLSYPGRDANLRRVEHRPPIQGDNRSVEDAHEQKAAPRMPKG